MKQRPLTLSKSRFKLGLECPAKLFFTGNDNYANKKNENEFMQALAEGGFQVGELAKLHYPGGVDLKVIRGSNEAVQATLAEISNGTRVIFEAAFQFGNLLIRADIIEITAEKVRLIEVKAKSFDGTKADLFNEKRTDLEGKLKPYLHDLAFQKYVVENAIQSIPELKGRKVVPHLMLADKSKQASVNGMQTNFRIERNSNDFEVIMPAGITLASLGNSVLREFDCSEEVDFVFKDDYNVKGFDQKNFTDIIHELENVYRSNLLRSCAPRTVCATCEFRNDDPSSGKRSGFHECHTQLMAGNVPPKTLVYELWGGGYTRKKSELIDDDFIFIDDIPVELLEAPEEKQEGHDEDQNGWLYQQRYVYQQELLKNAGVDYFINKEFVNTKMRSWEFPWHMIDFETSAAAIPFFKGLRPYEQVAFQFSHHIMEADGSVGHQQQYINITAGAFPNFEFVRALRDTLGNDGTIFRYATHENNILLAIAEQLAASAEPDKQQLIDFIDSITYSGKGKTRKTGNRNMVDLKDFVLKSFIHLDMKGSNSLKYVLPAIIKSSNDLQQKYSAPVYGSLIRSLNFAGKIWVTRDTKGNIIDPYKTLDTVLKEYDEFGNEELSESGEDEHVNNGGAAMMAWAEVQYTDTAPQRVQDIRKALLEYCELDTLAMVMLVEGLKDLSR
jgi:hypothetical protein